MDPSVPRTQALKSNLFNAVIILLSLQYNQSRQYNVRDEGINTALKQVGKKGVWTSTTLLCCWEKKRRRRRREEEEPPSAFMPIVKLTILSRYYVGYVPRSRSVKLWKICTYGTRFVPNRPKIIITSA